MCALRPGHARRILPALPRSGALPLDLAAAPELRGIRCPDGVHVDAESRAAFTALLAREVAARVPRARP